MSRLHVSQLETQSPDLGSLCGNPNFSNNINKILKKNDIILSKPDYNNMASFINSNCSTSIINSDYYNKPSFNQIINLNEDPMQIYLNRNNNKNLNYYKNDGITNTHQNRQNLLSVVNSTNTIKENYIQQYKNNNINYKNILYHFIIN